ncbi:MAG: S-layer homology domain-containing protein, partial [Ruminococcus sp.]|nr:S-layer homology domain-containing protein [Ruminococcus sp.]
MMKRIISVVLSLLIMLTSLPAIALSASAAEVEDGIILGVDNALTRAEWLHNLVETFDMYVEEEAMPDNYFSDLDESHNYYEDIILAVEFGVVNIPAGEELKPDDPVNRDFAVSTLNFCLGYQLEGGTEYTFTDYELCSDPDSAQVAVNRGWVTLAGTLFRPDLEITDTEITAMMKDAASVLEGQIVDPDYESEYTYAEDVIVIPANIPAVIDSNGTVTITNYSKTINEGDTFAVYINGIPDIYTAESVTTSGNVTTIATVDTVYDEAIVSADAQGTTEVIDSYFELAEGVKLVDEELEDLTYNSKATASTGTSADLSALGLEGSKAVKSKTLSKSLNLGDINVSLTVALSNLSVSYIADKKADHYMVQLNGDAYISTSASSSDLLSAIGDSCSIDLASYSVPGVGKVAISIYVSTQGNLTLNYDTMFSVGIDYTKVGGCRMIKNFAKKSFTIVANVSIDIGLKLYAKVNLINLLKGEVYASSGAKATIDSNTYTDGKSPKVCTTIKSWWYVTLGYSATIVKKTFSDSLSVFHENNSPARLYAHFEDGKEIASCSRNHSSVKYTSPPTTKYGSVSAPISVGSGDSSFDIDYGETIINKSLTLTSNRQVYGDLYLSSGTLDLNGYTLTVHGNLIQSSGDMVINHGTLNVGKDYRIQTKLSNGDFTSSYGSIKMKYNDDLVIVKGDFVMQSQTNNVRYNTLSAGTIKISGDFYQY